MKKLLILSVSITALPMMAQQQIEDLCNPNITSYAQFEAGIHYKDIHNKFASMLGVWKNVTGNKTFKVTLFKVEDVDYGDGYFLDEVQGHFMMIENEGQPNEVVLYQSNKPIGPGSPHYWPPVMQGEACGGNGFGGAITDNCALGNKTISGRLQITKIPGTNTAHWKVTRLKGIRLSDDPGFMIPTDIILTKQ